MIPWLPQGQYNDRQVRLSRVTNFASLDLPTGSLSNSTALIINRLDGALTTLEATARKIVQAPPLAVAIAGHHAALMRDAVENAMGPDTPFIMASYDESHAVADAIMSFFYAAFPPEEAFDKWTCIWVIVIGDTSAADVLQFLKAFIAR